MPDITILEILLYGEPVGTLTRIPGDRSIFAFNESYAEDAERPTLSLSFKGHLGELLSDFRPLQTRIMPFFSNMLPEGQLREYLADRAGVKPQREFFLLWVLGQDLPGAVTVRPVDGNADMHLKNWSLIYPDRRTASLAPAYDFLSTIVYLKDDNAALKYARTKRMAELTPDELAYMAAKSHSGEKLVMDAAAETVARFHETWSAEKRNLALGKKAVDTIDTHLAKLPVAKL